MAAWPSGTTAQTRIHVGTIPPAARAGMLWHRIDGEHHIEIPQGFVEEVSSRGTPEGQTEQSGVWSEIADQAKSLARDANGASQGKVSKWIWPGIPLIITGVKFFGWIFGKGRK